MKTILIVNGESYWPELLTDFNVVQRSIQHTSWIFKDERLYVAGPEGVVQPDGILWRVGAIRPAAIQTQALHLIDIARIPCVNDARCLRIGYDRLSMLGTLRHLGLPVIDFNVVTKSTQLKNIRVPYPFVVKVGNYHGGYGKVLVRDEQEWQDMRDLLFVSEDYITVEPFIDYHRDIRYLAIGEKVWAMSRRGQSWKANVGTVDYERIEPEAHLSAQVQKLQAEIGADIVAIDILEEATGRLHIVEYNDIPGLSGFSEELQYELAEVMRRKMGE